MIGRDVEMREEVGAEYARFDVGDDEVVCETCVSDCDSACRCAVARDAGPICGAELHSVGALTPLLRGRGDEGDKRPPVD